MGETTSTLWYRKFLRTADNDQDFPVDAAVKRELHDDFFADFLQNHGGDEILCLDDLLRRFYGKPDKYTFNIYAVADGAFIKDPIRDKVGEMTLKPWFNPHIRFVAVVHPTAVPPSGDKWTIFIVGSNELHSKERFLQVASWDPSIDEYRFFGRFLLQKGGDDPDGSLGWIYQGCSSNAIKPETTYLGPFNGHVNGALVMKELQRPWYHWMSGLNENITQCFSRVDRDLFMNAPYLTAGGILLSEVSGADELEPLIKNGVNKWFARRSAIEFDDASTDKLASTDKQPSSDARYGRNIQRWMSHILLTTTINISTAQANPDRTGEAEWVAPIDHFINNTLLHTSAFSDILPDLPALAFTDEHYQRAAKDLELCFIQEVDMVPAGYKALREPPGTLGGNKQFSGNEHRHKLFIKVQDGEGVPFVIAQPSYEDARGALEMQSITTDTGSAISLLSQQTFNALMMLDIWNPVYSWRRGVLMRYVPKKTSWCATNQVYDLEEIFIKSIRESTYAGHPGSPESEFLKLLHENTAEHKRRISAYFAIVAECLGTVKGLKDYLFLAESRRRVFRPLPLDEFGYTLPYSLKFDSFAGRDIFEMTEEGTTQPMDPRGIKFLYSWINTLWDVDPNLIPKCSPDDEVWDGGYHTLQDGELLEYEILQNLRGDRRERKKSGLGCPFAIQPIKQRVQPVAPLAMPMW